MRARVRRAVGVLAVVGALAAGCSSTTTPPPKVTVTGEPGVAPKIEFTAPLAITKPTVEVLAEGTGDPLEDGGPVLVNFYAESAKDGSLVNETYTSEPRAYELSEELLGVDIYHALHGQRAGARILHLVPPSDGETGTVAVFDVLPTCAQGEAQPPREGLPTVQLADDGEPTITVPAGAPAPTDLVVQPLIRGAGPQVAAGQVITVQYVGVTWSDGKVFESSWEDGQLPVSFPIGVQSVLAGWDTGLVEQTVGSQVLLVVPPSMGYAGSPNVLANETLVYVVDILSAVGGPGDAS